MAGLLLIICAGACTILTEDDVVGSVIIIWQLPELLGILVGVLVQAGVNRKLPSNFIRLKALERLSKIPKGDRSPWLI